MSNIISTEMRTTEDHEDALMFMIGEIIGQVSANYTRTMIASNRGDSDQVWSRYAEGLKLEEDLNALTKHRVMAMLTDLRRFDSIQ